MPISQLHAKFIAGDPSLPALVLMHGRGSDEDDLLPVGRLLHPEMPVLSVRAPFAAAPWGYGPGYAWYRFMGGTTPEAESFVAGQAALHTFLAELSNRFELSSGVVLGGFSQGGTTALAYALRNPGSVLGVIVFSGFLASHPSVVATSATVGATPIFWGHGTHDPAIEFVHAQAGWQALAKATANLTSKSYQGMGHSISQGELSDAAVWLQENILAR